MMIIFTVLFPFPQTLCVRVCSSKMSLDPLRNYDPVLRFWGASRSQTPGRTPQWTLTRVVSILSIRKYLTLGLVLLPVAQSESPSKDFDQVRES